MIYLVCLVPISIDCPPVLAMEIIQKRSPILRQVWPTHFGPALLRRPVLQRRGARGGRLCPADCEAASGGSAGAGRGGEVTRWMGDRCWSLGLDIVYIYIYLFINHTHTHIYIYMCVKSDKCQNQKFDCSILFHYIGCWYRTCFFFWGGSRVNILIHNYIFVHFEPTK